MSEQETNYTATTEDSTALRKFDTMNVEMRNIHDFNFDPTFNVRDVQNYDAAVQRKIEELRRDMAIRTPLQAAVLVTQSPGEKPIGVCGFLRSAALKALAVSDPDFFHEHFATIPIIVHQGITERERISMLLDHGSEEELDEYEVYLSEKRLIRQKGMYSQRAQIAMLSRLFYRLAGAKDRTGYDLTLKELREKKVVMKGKTICKEQADVAFLFFRGRYQYYQRIAESAPCVEEAFRKFVRGEEGGVHITFKMAEQLHGLSAEGARQVLDAALGGKAPTESQHWTKPVLANALATSKSEYYTAQLKAALGDVESQGKLHDLEDELIAIEKAKNADPTTFWNCVNDIITNSVN